MLQFAGTIFVMFAQLLCAWCCNIVNRLLELTLRFSLTALAMSVAKEARASQSIESLRTHLCITLLSQTTLALDESLVDDCFYRQPKTSPTVSIAGPASASVLLFQ